MRFVCIIGISMIISLCISSYWLYKDIKCNKIAQYSCRNEKCLLRGSCCKYKLSDAEAKEILELLKKL